MRRWQAWSTSTLTATPVTRRPSCVCLQSRRGVQRGLRSGIVRFSARSTTPIVTAHCSACRSPPGWSIPSRAECRARPETRRTVDGHRAEAFPATTANRCASIRSRGPYLVAAHSIDSLQQGRCRVYPSLEIARYATQLVDVTRCFLLSDNRFRCSLTAPQRSPRKILTGNEPIRSRP